MFTANDQIGPYLLLKSLGNGAFGEVWLAEKRTAVASIRVALKLPTRSAVDMEAVRQEAAVWEQAKGHPNVLPLTDADIYEFKGREYVAIVSEYADGGTLENWLEKKGGSAPTPEVAFSLMDGILSGLRHLHTRRPPIVHRDLKPANILLQSQQPRLADFGLARVLKSTAGSATIAGTVEYMSPDALDGSRAAATDIWSAGVILYQMLSGGLPFPQRNKTELMYAITLREPALLPDTVPPELQAIVLRALHKDPAQRFFTADAMRQALRDIAENRRRAVIYEQYKADDEARRQAEAHRQQEEQARQREAEARRQKEETARLRRELEEARRAQPAVTEPSPTVTPRPLAELPPTVPASGLSTNAPRLWPKVAAAGGTLALVLSFAGYWLFGKTATNNQVTTPNEAQRQTAATLQSYTQPLTNLPANVKQLEMVAIAPGKFTMGSPEGEAQRYIGEGPQREVNIKYGFYLGKYEVTQAQWKAVMGTEPNNFKNCPDCPVERVSWDDAQEFIKKLNSLQNKYLCRLPSEAEWEYAARSGTNTAFAFGDSLSSEQANFDGNYPYGGAAKGEYKAQTTPVGSYAPNAWGLYDMHGNVWEWCEDIYQDNYKGLPTDGSANVSAENSSLRVLRGGSWGGYGLYCRSAVRIRSTPNVHDVHIGFRLVAVART